MSHLEPGPVKYLIKQEVGKQEGIGSRVSIAGAKISQGFDLRQRDFLRNNLHSQYESSIVAG